MGAKVISADVTTLDLDWDGPKAVTCFTDDGVGIDPAGCGCTDCIVGDSISFEDGNSNKLAALAYEVFNDGRKFYHRVGSYAKLIPVQDGDNYGFKLKW